MEKRTNGMSVKYSNELDVLSPVMLVFAVGNDDDVVLVAIDNVTSTVHSGGEGSLHYDRV